MQFVLWHLTGWLEGPLKNSFYQSYLIPDNFAHRFVAWPNENSCGPSVVTMISNEVFGKFGAHSLCKKHDFLAFGVSESQGLWLPAIYLLKFSEVAAPNRFPSGQLIEEFLSCIMRQELKEFWSVGNMNSMIKTVDWGPSGTNLRIQFQGMILSANLVKTPLKVKIDSWITQFFE